MNFRARPNLSFDSLSYNSKEIYFSNVLAWKLPRDAGQNKLIRKMFRAETVRQLSPEAYSEIFEASSTVH
jgi:hypothetical protein